jgi:type IV pilus assembly protein PilW
MTASILPAVSVKTKRLQSGISLVEILVSLVISLFLLGGIIQVYLGNTSTYKFANALSEVQENGRFALETISQDLRAIGDWGCINFNPAVITNINNTLAVLPGFNAALQDFAVNPPVNGTNDTGGLATTDTLTISGSSPGQVNITAPFSTPAQAFLTVSNLGSFTAGDIALVTRCGANDLLIPQEADIFMVSGIDTVNSRLNHATVLSQQYQNDATIKKLQTVTYAIGAGTIVDATGLPQPTLFRSLDGVNQALIEGIEDMQILYGIDTDGINTAAQNFANQYVTANNVANFRSVVSIRVMLLVRSTEDFVTDQSQAYTFNSATPVTATDRRIRQVFTATIALRNRAGIER